MRSQFWRFLLTLSLLLTLPMQGYAAARMASCDAVLAGALAGAFKAERAGGAHNASRQAAHGMHDGGLQDAAHEMAGSMLQDGSHVTSLGMSNDAFHDPSHGMTHGASDADGSQHGSMSSSAHSGSQDSHGSSCMSCTPCSPGATLTCVVPVISTFLSARVLPALLAAPASVDLAHPERPPQAFLA